MVNKSIGLLLPFTVTLSNYLSIDLIGVERRLAKLSLTSKGTPYCLVAAYSLDAILTFGDRYEASILCYDPIAP